MWQAHAHAQHVQLFCFGHRTRLAFWRGEAYFFRQLTDARGQGGVEARRHFRHFQQLTFLRTGHVVRCQIQTFQVTTEADGETVFQLSFSTGCALVHGPVCSVTDDLAGQCVEDQLTQVFQLVNSGAAHASETSIHFHHQVMDFVSGVQTSIALHVADQVVRYEVWQDAEGHFVTLGAFVQFRHLCLRHGVTPNGQRKGGWGERTHPEWIRPAATPRQLGPQVRLEQERLWPGDREQPADLRQQV
ncbi:hypothetical protein D3C81_662540 [compost metagenome]